MKKLFLFYQRQFGIFHEKFSRTQTDVDKIIDGYGVGV